MRSPLVRAAVLAIAACVTASPARAAALEPSSLYGDEIVFDVFREGDRVGRHRTTFERTASGLRVVSDFSVRIEILGFEVYAFDYAAAARWRDGALREIAVRIDDDGMKTRIDGAATTEGFRVRGPKGEVRGPAGIIPTNHWNVRQVDQSTLLNTLTGTMDPVTVTPLGEETVETGTGPRKARRYRYEGGFEAESWYDDAGRWVKLRFSGRDGSTIEYRCRKCGSDAALAKGEP